MIVLVPHHNIEHHSAEHLLRFLVGKPQSAHYSENLFVRICPEQPIVEVRNCAERLHMHFLSINPVEPLCQEMRSAILFNQRAFCHFNAAFLYKVRERVLQSTEVFSFLEPGSG